MIKIKSKEEILIMKEGGAILARILNQLVAAVKPGINTLDLEHLARNLINKSGTRSSFLGYGNYPAVLCTSINEEIVHGVPSERKLTDGDVLKIDVGLVYKDFHTDMATTIIVGNRIDRVKQQLLNVTRDALNVGISKAKVGNTIGDIGAAVQKYVENKGLNVVRDLVGHGIGKDLHEEPQVPNYGEPGTGPELVEGMVVAIEPMVVTGSWKIKEEGFVFSTKDKSLAAHFEHTVAVTDSGPSVLTAN